MYSLIHCLLPQVSFDRTTKKKVIQHKLIHILFFSFSLYVCAPPDRNKNEREREREKKRYSSIAFAVVILLNQRVNIRREKRN